MLICSLPLSCSVPGHVVGALRSACACLSLHTTCCHSTAACRYNADLERVVRQRVRRGRHFPIMKVIPPGLDFSNLKISPPPDPLEVLNAGSGAWRLGAELTGAKGVWPECL